MFVYIETHFRFCVDLSNSKKIGQWGAAGSVWDGIQIRETWLQALPPFPLPQTLSPLACSHANVFRLCKG